MENQNYYLCRACMGVTKRESTKKRIRSLCVEANKDVYLTRIDNTDVLAVHFQKHFIGGSFELNSFSPKEQSMLKYAFETGVKVMFNSLKP